MSSTSSTATVRRRVIYRGRVQGVGFRANVARLSLRFPVGGSVRNLPDGTVELIVDAEPDVFAEFHEAIQDRFVGYITSCDIERLSVQEPFTRFRVRL